MANPAARRALGLAGLPALGAGLCGAARVPALHGVPHALAQWLRGPPRLHPVLRLLPPREGDAQGAPHLHAGPQSRPGAHRRDRRLHVCRRRVGPAGGRGPGGGRRRRAERLQKGAHGPRAVHRALHQPLRLSRGQAEEILLCASAISQSLDSLRCPHCLLQSSCILIQRWLSDRCRPPQTAPRASQWTIRRTDGC